VTVLGKRHVERLLATYDVDPVGALTEALQVVLDRPDAAFDTLIDTAVGDTTRRSLLHARHPEALDALAAELNERRTI
jgi:hypothetical protein